MQSNVITDELNDRVKAVVNDVRTFLFVRIHNTHTDNGLGGGNITCASILFNTINLLSKVNYFLAKPECFVSQSEIDGIKAKRTEVISKLEETTDKRFVKDYTRVPRLNETDETSAFKAFVKDLGDAGIDLGIPVQNDEAMQLIWNGFRNKLAHVSTIEIGKQVITFTFASSGSRNVCSFLKEARQKYKPFEGDYYGRNWQVNTDVLTGYMPEILACVLRKLDAESLDAESINRLRDIVS